MRVEPQEGMPTERRRLEGARLTGGKGRCIIFLREGSGELLLMICVILREGEPLLAVFLERVLIQVGRLTLIRMHHLVMVVVPYLFGDLLCLDLGHASPTAHVVWVCTWHGRALLKESIVNLSSRNGHGEKDTGLVVVIVVVKVLQHEKCPTLGLLRREHIHQRFITKGRQSEATLPMNLCRFLLVIQLTRLFASGDYLSSQLSWK